MREPNNSQANTQQEGNDDDSYLHQPRQPGLFVESA
jgi:hypothetical protein